MTSVTIFGPNLNDQSKGQFHVHATGCKDCKNYGPRGRQGGDGGESVEVSSVEEVVDFMYGPDAGGFYEEHGDTHFDGVRWLNDDDNTPTWAGLYRGDFYFFPCVPVLPGQVEPEPGVELTTFVVSVLVQVDAPAAIDAVDAVWKALGETFHQDRIQTMVLQEVIR